eukprot:6076964-Alexandrium_andersonii.AAC.1
MERRRGQSALGPQARFGARFLARTVVPRCHHREVPRFLFLREWPSRGGLPPPGPPRFPWGLPPPRTTRKALLARAGGALRGGPAKGHQRASLNRGLRPPWTWQ